MKLLVVATTEAGITITNPLQTVGLSEILSGKKLVTRAKNQPTCVYKQQASKKKKKNPANLPKIIRSC